jgi:hypothetical protein
LCVRNLSGRGRLRGSVIVDPLVLWLSVTTHFDGDTDMLVAIDTGSAPEGTRLETSLRFKTAYEERVVPVRGRVAYRWLPALGRIGLIGLAGAGVGAVLAFLGMNAPTAGLTLLGIGALALAAAGYAAWRAQGNWMDRLLRFAIALPLAGLLLWGTNWLAHLLWGPVQAIDPRAAWLVPVGAGAIVGLAGGVVRVLDRPGRRLIPWAFAALVLFLSLMCGGVTLLRVLAPWEAGGPAIWQATPSPDIGEATWVIVETQGTGLNVRQQPGTGAEVIGQAAPGARLGGLDGPVERDGYVWWRVELPDGTMGWVAENWLRPVEP